MPNLTDLTRDELEDKLVIAYRTLEVQSDYWELVRQLGELRGRVYQAEVALRQMNIEGRYDEPIRLVHDTLENPVSDDLATAASSPDEFQYPASVYRAPLRWSGWCSLFGTATQDQSVTAHLPTLPPRTSP